MVKLCVILRPKGGGYDEIAFWDRLPFSLGVCRQKYGVEATIQFYPKKTIGRSDLYNWGQLVVYYCIELDLEFKSRAVSCDIEGSLSSTFQMGLVLPTRHKNWLKNESSWKLRGKKFGMRGCLPCVLKDSINA